MLSIKNEIEKNIKLYMSLKRIFYIKSKDIDVSGNVTVKEDFIRAAQKFNIRTSSTGEFDDASAEILLNETKLNIVKELLSITEVILEVTENLKKEKIIIESYKNETDHLKVFKYCFHKLIQLKVVSPHDTIEYEPIYDKEEDMIGVKLMTDTANNDEI